MRRGDFSASADPADRSGDRPAVRRQSDSGRAGSIRGAALLLGFIPAPNLPGTTQNYHVSTTSHSTSDSVSLRLTQNLSPTRAAGARRRRRGGRGGGGRGGGLAADAAGGGGRGRGTNIMLNAQLQYRRNQNEALNVFPEPGRRRRTNTSISAPISLNIAARPLDPERHRQPDARATSQSTNAFAGAQNVAARGRHSVSERRVDRSAELGRAEPVVFRLHRRAQRRGQHAGPTIG